MAQTTHFRVTESIGNPNWAFPAGRIIAVKPGDRLPETLATVTERYEGPLPMDMVTFDPEWWVAVNTPRVEPEAPRPVSEADLRKRLRLQDEELWTLAKSLGFPDAAMRRSKPLPPPLKGKTLEPLWQETDVTNWLDRFRRVATMVLAGRS